MGENNRITAEIDVEAAVSEIAAREVSAVMESGRGDIESDVSEDNFTVTDISKDTFTENFTTAVTDNSLLPPETTAVFTETEETLSVSVIEPLETSEVVVSEPEASIAPVQMTVPVLVALLALSALALKKFNYKRDGKTRERKYAKDKDAERIEMNKAKKSRKKDSKNPVEKEKRNLSKKTLDTVPYKQILSDNIWYLGKKNVLKGLYF